MTSLRSLPYWFFHSFTVLAGLLAVALGSMARAANINYAPGQFDVAGNTPFTQTSVDIKIQRPSGTADGTTITLSVTPLGIPQPDGSFLPMPAEALTAITVSPTSLTFNAGDTFKTFQVTASYQSLGLPPNTIASLIYKVFTSWHNGGLHNDQGFNVNATVTVSPVQNNAPPTITIQEPAQSSYTVHAADLAAFRVPLAFRAVTSSPQTIIGMSATYTGPGVSPNGAPISVQTTFDDATFTAATATGQMATPRAGTYVVVVRGANGAGDATLSRSYEIVVPDGPLPGISITSPAAESEYNYYVGGSPAHVPGAISATADALAPLESWTAELSGPVPAQTYPITPSAPSGTSAAGTLTMDLTESGHYTLKATAFNLYGSKSATQTFWVNKIVNPASATGNALDPVGVAFEIAFTGKPNVSYTYQWQRKTVGGSFANITYTSDGITSFAGATTSRLTITTPRGGMSGEQYQCVVTGGLAPVTSGAATLTVKKLNQTISFTAHPTATIGDPSFNLNASVAPDASRPLTYESSVASVAAVDQDGAVTINAVGTTLLSIRQAGDENYNAVTVNTGLEVKPIVLPAPSVTIDSPVGDVPLPVGQTTAPVSLNFTATPNTGFAISRVVAVLDATTYDSNVVDTFSFTSPLPSSTSTTGSRIVSVGLGSHTLTVTSYIGATASAPATKTFNVVEQACGTALVNHAAVLNGQALIRGSLKIMTGEKMSLDGQAWITDNLYLPGTPTVKLTGNSIIDSTVSAGGSASPSKYTLTLNGNAAIGTLVAQSNPVPILSVATPPASAGTRDVTINKPGDSLGNPATIRDFTVNGKAGAVTLPPGTYRDVTVTGNNVLVLTAGTYNIRELKISGAQEVRVTGPVVVNVVKDVKLSGKWGTTADPSLVKLNIADGGLTLTGNGRFYGFVNAPAGEVTLTGLQLLKGGVIADELTVTGQGTIELCDTP